MTASIQYCERVATRVFLNVTSAQLQRIWRAYGVAPQTARSEHSASTVVLDGRGHQRVGFATSVLTPEALAHDIGALERTRKAT